jgi:hypothetical protein
MNRLVKLGLAAALLAGASPAALAQDAGSSTSQSATAILQPNYETFVSKLDASADVDVSGLTATSNVRFVKIDSLEGWDATKFDAEIGTRTADMTALRGKLGADPDLMTKLEGAGYSIDDVVAIESGADGFTVYVDDRA